MSPASKPLPITAIVGGAAAIGVIIMGLLFVAFQLHPLPALSELQAHQSELLSWQQSRPWLFGLAFFSLFTLLAALALPGCSVMSLAAGICFGWLGGTLLVVFASTAGATLSFLAARYLWRDAVQRRFGHRLAAVEARLARDGARFVFSLRVAPVIPYPLFNPLLGLSRLPATTFFIASLLGMLAGSAVYVYAGIEMAKVSSWGGLLNPPMLAALALLALLPWVGRLWAGIAGAVAPPKETR
jgi:uncharacterized membrane protein YdjX (TVP38/TMEM64 family)